MEGKMELDGVDGFTSEGVRAEGKGENEAVGGILLRSKVWIGR